ncbi:MAG TPA: 3-oxoacyl-ACP reductase FabG, partial [Magnetospirillaceae bacterium]|nr:3-oxoacyl-ACP reductase FabG [Magnetospirillaceae bacterium]
MEPGLLSGAVAIVTGGSRGIGRAVAAAFLREGARVHYFSRTKAEDHAGLEALAAEAGGAVSWTSCDVADADSVGPAVEAVAASEGRIDVLVNNAGITRDNLVFRMSLEEWDSVVRTNLTSAFLVSRAAARHMIRRRSGSIVNITSVVGITGNGGQTNYSASKAGLIGFTKSLAREVSGRKVRVNAVAPGYIDTAMTEALPEDAKARLVTAIPLGRTGSPEEVA